MKLGYLVFAGFCITILFLAGTSVVIAREKGNDSLPYSHENQFIGSIHPSLTIKNLVIPVSTSRISAQNSRNTLNLIPATKKLEYYYSSGRTSGNKYGGNPPSTTTPNLVICINLPKKETWNQTGNNQFKHCVSTPYCKSDKSFSTNPQDATYTTVCKTVPVCNETDEGTIGANDINAKCAPDIVIETPTPSPTQTTTPTVNTTQQGWVPLTATLPIYDVWPTEFIQPTPTVTPTELDCSYCQYPSCCELPQCSNDPYCYK